MTQFKKLIQAAKRARGSAYAPYSKFRVGAAVLSKSGKIFSAANVENASYGLSICAERAAIFKAVSEGCREISAVAIFAGTKEPVTPCGACRQVISEFSKDADVVMVPLKGKERTEKNSKLLPGAFGKKALLLLGLAVLLSLPSARAEESGALNSASVQELVEALRSPSVADVQKAKQALGSRRFQDVKKPLLNLAKDARPEVRRVAAQVLGELGKGEVISQLQDMCEKDSAASVRRAALIQLTVLFPYGKSTFNYMKGVVFSDTDSDNRYLALTHLFIIAMDQGYFKELKQVCWKVWELDMSPRNRIFAAVTLAENGENKPVLWDALLDGVRGASVEIRRRASLVIGAVNDSKFFPRITGIAQDPDVEVRINLCQALVVLQNVSGIPTLKLLYSDKDPLVRKSALAALSQFQREDIEEGFFLTALADTDAMVRSEAIRILEASGDAAALAKLERVSATDPDMEVRYLAKKAFVTISAKVNPEPASNP